MKTLITNAYVLDMVGDTANIEKKEILINDNIIEIIDKEIDKDIEVDEKINAKNMLVMPGLVNTHTHLAMSIFRGYKTDKKLMDWLENAIYPVEDKLKPDYVIPFKLDKKAAYLNIPYVIWILYAGVLNYFTWIINR